MTTFDYAEATEEEKAHLKATIKDSLKRVYGERYDDLGLDGYITYCEIYNNIFDEDVCKCCTVSQYPMYFTSSSMIQTHPHFTEFRKIIKKEECQNPEHADTRVLNIMGAGYL